MQLVPGRTNGQAFLRWQRIFSVVGTVTIRKPLLANIGKVSFTATKTMGEKRKIAIIAFLSDMGIEQIPTTEKSVAFFIILILPICN